MLRMPITPRPDWQAKAEEFGFHFHTLYGEPYWDESAYYQFNLRQIEDDLEAPSAELHQMCLAVVEQVVRSDALMQQFGIPEPLRDTVKQSWLDRDPSLYSRLDFCYDGRRPAKLYENNADTPTSLYETGFWQWLWLEDQVNRGHLRRDSDQFNSLQEQLVARFAELATTHPGMPLYLSCCQDSEEDRGTVQYLQDCAEEAGISTHFLYIEEIGEGEGQVFTDQQDRVIPWLFKLYPWEFMFREDYAELIRRSGTRWLEPPWKSLLSNKALLPALWQQFPRHPNLLPAFFTEKEAFRHGGDMVKKPLFSREGANVTLLRNGKARDSSDGPYGEEGFVFQQYQPLPRFGDHHTLVGSWLVNDRAAGISIREDRHWVTRDLSRYLPHIILD